ncbi:iron-containing alcohol dehydrogenase [Arthrobacter sp. RAF14]|uniref:iron-containing alcohol dehydrogenase n=1 Tax=Arthrobacter sp. RAF14 TaxID=3233051 RepID=UPI003F923FEC
MSVRVLSGDQALADHLVQSSGSGTTMIIVDRAAEVSEKRFDGTATDVLEVSVGQGGLRLEEIRQIVTRIRQLGPREVLGVGGGSVMDAVKIAVVCAEQDGRLEHLAVRSARSGLVPLGGSWRRSITLALVPTTIGTSSEVNSTATILTPAGRRLVLGESLRPDIAILDAELTQTLPPHLVAEGVMEAFLRVAGVFAWTPRPRTIERTAINLARAILSAGLEQPAADRKTLGLVSAATHTSGALISVTPYPMKHWYIANELSYAARVRKIEATVPLIGPVWARILQGDSRFGDAATLNRFWDSVGELVPGACLDPVNGIRSLAATLGIATKLPVSSMEIASCANSCIRNWGGPLPMLPGLTAADIRSLLEESSLPRLTAAD